MIALTPLSLSALITHEIAPHEQRWFARCRADYLRNFPAVLLETVRFAALIGLSGRLDRPAFVLAGLGALALVLAALGWVQLREALPPVDQLADIDRRRKAMGLRIVCWAGLLAWGLAIAAPPSRETLVALGLAMMAIDGLQAVSMPRTGLVAALSGAAGLAVGLVLAEGLTALPVVIVAGIGVCFMHWSIFNLYYLFATRRIRTRRLRQSNDTIRLLLNQYDDEGSDWLWETDGEGRIRNPSPRFCAAAQLGSGGLEGRRLTDLLPDNEEARSLAGKLANRETFRDLVVPVTLDGQPRWWSINGRPTFDHDGHESGWRGFIADITAAREAEAKVAFLAHHDLLTGLPNRTQFTKTLDTAFTAPVGTRGIGLLYIDLDLFKTINDTLGHAAGDAVLIEVARRLRASVRPGDLVARLGGDEFVVLLPRLDTHRAAVIVAERILAAITAPFDHEGTPLPLGASIGLALAPDDAESGIELLRAADTAMYAAKTRGRRGISLFDPAMLAGLRERRQLELDLRGAVARQELALAYQPIHEAGSGRITAYEALLRWHHPEHGSISPAQLLPIAEESGQIREIGAWVIRSAIAEAARWPGQHRVAINLAPAQLRDDSLIGIVLHAIAASGLPAQRIELEITESLLLDDDATASVEVLLRLRAIGVRIVLDDFGAGASSLTYLRSFPFDKIKIDRGFIAEIEARRDCQAIVRSVLSLARELNMITAAEGVERESQLALLQAGGCDEAQGYLFSPALSVTELHQRMGITAPPPEPANDVAVLVVVAPTAPNAANPPLPEAAAG